MTDRLHPPSAPPLLADRYRLVDEVGRGGMGSVHLARDEVLDRDVAVKLLHPHLAGDDGVVDRFHREARAAAGIDHPGVVRVHDYGTDDGTAYLVMEHVPGRSLRDVLRVRGRLTPAEALALLLPACGGLAAAHRAGLVHRDVTPNNLLVGDDGRTRLTDFGLARSVATATMTVEGLVGSPHYLAPEVVLGDRADARADVYGLGCVLYECLTGRPPFEAESPVAVATMHTTETVPAPSATAAGVPAAVDRVVATATARDPGERYADAEAFALALSAAVPDGPAVVDLRDGTDSTVVLPEHATRAIGELEHDAARQRRFGLRRRAPGRGGRRWPRRLLTLLLVAVLGAGAWVGWDRVWAPVDTVPSVVGVAGADALDALVAAGYAVAVEPDRVTDPEVPEGAVVEQRPGPDAELRRRSTVALVLSDGPATAEMPDVADLTPDDAAAALAGLGIDLEIVRSRAFDDRVPEGDLIAVTDGEGTRLDAGTTLEERDRVVVTTSSGPEPLPVPALAGLSEGEALATANDLGLVARVVGREFDDDLARGRVLSVEPEAGTTVRRGDEVRLTLSDGPAPVEVPDVEGRPVESATAALRDLGLEVEVRDVSTLFPFRRGQVDQQDPSPGTTLRRGDRVLLFVWR